jgi:hypothetical protein
MDTQEFFSAILPPGGVYIIAAQTPKGFRHKGFKTIAEAAAFALKCDATGVPTYHACAAYKSEPHRTEDGKLIARTSSNWKSAKAFWLDIDCGEDKAAEGKGYATQRDGAGALLSWCKRSGIAFPMLVNSGRGLHAYWVLTEEVEPARWVQVASCLKQVMIKDGLKIDPSRSSDFASVLRPVGTHNRKDPQHPKEVKVVYSPKGAVPTEEFCAKVEELAGAHGDALGARPAWLEGEDAEEIGHYTEIESSAVAASEKCMQMRIMRDTKGDVSYDHWRGVIGVIKHSVEGMDLAMDWSSRRAETGHTNTDVETRFNTWSSGPTTCQFFEACNPSGCKDCPYKGKVKSPIMLGRITPAPEAQSVDGVVEGDPKAQTVAVQVPELPEGYAWDGTFLVHYTKNKEGVLEAHPFCRTLFYLIDRIRNAEGTYESVARVHLPNRVVRTFNLDGKLVGAGGSKLLELLGSYEILTLNTRDALQHMSSYIKDAVYKLTEQKAVRATHTTFGWQEDKSFLVGTRLYHSDGTQTEALLSGYAANNKSCFPAPTGTVEGYSDALNWVYNRPGMEPMQYMICSLFGSPLVDFCEPTYNGIPCALTGSDSGKGKTTAAMAGLYAFGQAYPGMVVAGKAGATVRARAALLGTFGNLPMLFDEITNMTTPMLSDLCYAISNGVENMRLRIAKGGVEFSERASWRTQVALTGNASIIDRLSLGGNTEAEAMRIFEIQIDQYDLPKLNPLEVAEALSTMERNAGCAGELLIKYIVTHRKEVVETMSEVYDSLKISDDLMQNPKYRFYRDHMLCTLSAARIMSDLGVVKFDLDKLHAFAIAAVRKLFLDAAEVNKRDPREVAAEMISDLSPKIVSTPTYVLPDGAPPYAVSAPYGLVGRAIRGDAGSQDPLAGMLLLSAKAVRQWCSDNRVDTNKLAIELRDLKVLLDRRDRRSLGRGTTVVSASQRCWRIDMAQLDNFMPSEGEEENGDL